MTKTPRYSKYQPSGFENVIRRVAVVGAGGTIGSYITAALLDNGWHTVTAISRKGSSNKLPNGVIVATVDYDDESSLVAALRGQQFLIITMAPMAPRETHSRIVQAAAKAGVPYVMPNGYGPDPEDVKLGADTMLGPIAKANRDEIEHLGGEARFGFDFDNRAVTIYDDGVTKISTSTLPQVARAVAKVLSLKELPDDESDENLTLAAFVNHSIFITSFMVSQHDMFQSVKRVTCTTEADWKVTSESTQKRYEDGLAQVRGGDMSGFGKLLYARSFYPNAPSDLSAKAQNELLGLEKESLDEFTRRGVDMVKDLQCRAERMAS